LFFALLFVTLREYEKSASFIVPGHTRARALHTKLLPIPKKERMQYLPQLQWAQALIFILINDN
jgi:hypothetical protein